MDKDTMDKEGDIGGADISDRVRVVETHVAAKNFYTLRLGTFEWRRSDGSWQTQKREIYDMGDGAGVLPIDRAKNKVLLIRQFRWPVFQYGHHRMMIEVVAGKLEDDNPQLCVEREAMEEAGITISNPKRVFYSFMSPGAVGERLSLYVADYDSTARAGQGGGLADEGEDIEVLEMSLDDAMAMVANGEILDAKTIMLLQWAVLNR